MVEQAIKPYVVAVAKEIQQTLGATLHSLFSYGSVYLPHYSPLHSDINLLVVLHNHADLHETRLLLESLWHRHKAQLKRPPRVGLQKTISRHLQLEPLFLRHLQQHAREHTDTGWLGQLKPVIQMPAESHLIRQSFNASRALNDPDFGTDLSRVWRQTDPSRTGDLVTPAEQLASVWRVIDRQQEGRSLGVHVSKPIGKNLSPFSNLVSLYNRLDTVIAVVSSANDLMSTRWNAVSAWLEAERADALYLTTPTQFLTLLHAYGALDVRLLSYDHMWGTDLVGMLNPGIRQVRQAAARYATDLQMNYYSENYFGSAVSQPHGQKHIHDLQNKLLNLRLQNEIMSRLKLVSPFVAPEALPPRGTPHPKRFHAIYQQLAWWTDYYLSE